MTFPSTIEGEITTKIVLIDAGAFSKNRILHELRIRHGNYVSFDYTFLSHWDYDHYQGHLDLYHEGILPLLYIIRSSEAT